VTNDERWSVGTKISYVVTGEIDDRNANNALMACTRLRFIFSSSIARIIKLLIIAFWFLQLH
jgi:hypothetical protein